MRWIRRGLILFALLWSAGPPARAADIDGLRLPETEQVDGTMLRLNGFGLRTWSLLNIHVYVASLYLEHPNSDAGAIIRSPEPKLLIFRFERDVSADAARAAWRRGLENNCPMPCRLEPADVDRFLAEVPPMHAGDCFELRFAQHTAVITVNGQLLGRIEKPTLADAVLSAILGPRPGSPSVKQALLEGHG